MLFWGENTEDYVITNASTPDMTAFTVCFWVKSIQTTKNAELVSYATSEHPNEILIHQLRSEDGLRIQLMKGNTYNDVSK